MFWLRNKKKYLPNITSSGCKANNVNPDQVLHSAVSDVDLHCLLSFVCLNSNNCK